jgi:hypothetical protein
MCVIAVKYLPNAGWIGVKNRDRGYYPIINIRKSKKGGIERIYIWDETTRYTEGMNEFGVSIISASMATISDEKGISTTRHEGTDGAYYSPDGKKIRNALLCKTVEDAVQTLADSELTGHTFVFDKEKCMLLECARRNGDTVYKIKIIEPSESSVRTNHGVLLPWAGYQRVPGDPTHSRKRVCSEYRKLISEKGIEKASSLDEALECILDHSNSSDPQLNPCRRDDRKGYMNTTGQLALVPGNLTLYYRPIWSGINFSYEKLNVEGNKCFFEILSQRKLHQLGPDSKLAEPQL